MVNTKDRISPAMIEAGAHALADAVGDGLDWRTTFGTLKSVAADVLIAGVCACGTEPSSRVVPFVPTPAMVEAGMIAYRECEDYTQNGYVTAIFQAMVNAATSPSASA